MTTPATQDSITTTTPSKVDRIKILLKSKTVWGSFFAAGSWLLSQPQITLKEVVQAIGMFIAAAGVRDAITQHGVTQ